MKYRNKLAIAACTAVSAMMMMTGCEGGDLYSVGSPDWIADKVDSIKNANTPTETPLEGQMEDVYDIGNAEFSAGFFTLGKTYVIPAGAKWQCQFNLTVNPDNKYYKNFYIVLNNYADGLGDEYGVIRYDNDPSKNSEWNTTGTEIDRNLVGGNFSNSSGSDDLDPSVQKMNGKITLTVDRSNGGLSIEMTNGSLVKTYKQTSPFPSTGATTELACRIGVEGSLVGFLSTNIVPIGGLTEAGDKQPVSMKLKGVPAKVLQGSDFDEILKGVTAEVTFDGLPSPVTVKSEDLTIETVPNVFDLGTKTLVAVYNKTYKGEGATKPVIATAQFVVVDKMYTTIGATDNSTAFWKAHSEAVKVAPYETVVTTFTNYTSGGGNWNNFVIVLATQDGGTEYGVLRADNWGWGTGWTGEELATKCMPSGGQADWASWLAAMDGAKVTVCVTNNGDGTADVRTTMLGNDGQIYTQDYIGLNTVTNPDDFYFHFTVDNCHLEFDDVLGAENNSTDFWNAHSEAFRVEPGRTLTRRFKNYTNGGGNWENFVIVLASQDGGTEYGVLRADNWGWGTGWPGEELGSHCMPSGGQSDWATWLAAMDEAMVTVSVTNNGDGTADVRCVMVGNDGQTYTQDYIGLNTVTDPEDFFFHFTVDHSHLVFE